MLGIVKETPQGLYLNGGRLGEILLPRRYVPQKYHPDGVLDVFIYLDSEDRLVATTEQPLAMVGEFACLKVVALNRGAGAFLDWGLSKDLLLPFSEQEGPVRIGQKVVVAVDYDDRTGRIVASAKIKRYLSTEPPPYRTGQQVQLLIARNTPLGYEAIVENSHLGLLFKNNILSPLEIGEKTAGYIKSVRPDGKIDLSLDALGYQKVGSHQLSILNALQQSGGKIPLDDDSDPELIRETFGISKKAFKQALGALYKDRRITFTRPGIQLQEKRDQTGEESSTTGSSNPSKAPQKRPIPSPKEKIRPSSKSHLRKQRDQVKSV